jgi:hypothetical protein
MTVYEPVEEFIIIMTNPDLSDEYNVKKVIGNSKVQKYIIAQCSNIYKENKKQHPSLSKELPSDLINNIRKRYSTFKDVTITNMLTDPSAGFFNIGGYVVCAFGNAVCMTLVKVIFHIKDSDSYLVINLPTPTSNDVRDAGYRPN